jgi:2-polyprenyl-6-hydroxyphenyl methylase / 3-demethylubiquinone-9 3-methyltransferase
MQPGAATINPADVAHFNRLAADWWRPDGPSKPLFALNPARLGYIRDQAKAHFARAGGRQLLLGLDVVDVGCGGGIVSEPLARLGGKVIGLDAAPDNIAVAHAHAKEMGLAIEYRVATAGEAADAGLRADLVVSLEVIEHVSDPALFLSDCTRLLKPGGLLILSTPNRSLRSFATVIFAAEYLLRQVPRGTHDWQRFIRPEEMRHLLAGAGLELIDMSGLSIAPLKGSWSVSPDMVIDYILAARRAA